MNFSFVPSLESMTVTQIVTKLWNRADVTDLIAKCDESYRGGRWRMIGDNVNEKISLLPPLPAPLREKLSSLVVPIGDQIRRWKATHIQEFGLQNIPREFWWTSRGTLDKKRTAEAFVCDPTLPQAERYVMACLYCLEWDDPVPFLKTISFDLWTFQAYWTYDRTGDATALDEAIERDTSNTPYQCAFHWAVRYGNVVAAEYYFCKLSPGETEELLSDVELRCYLTDLDMYRFLVRHTDKKNLFGAEAEEVLLSLLDWPWHQFFIDVARCVRDNLYYCEYSHLLKKIVRKVEEGYRDYSYRELFGALWGQIPMHHKKEMMDDWPLLRRLFPFIGEKNVSLLLKEASQEEREKIILSFESVCICSTLADRNEWDSLECFIGECITSRDRMIHFKEMCEKEIMLINRPFFQFLDELIEKFAKDSGGQEADCPVPKRLCRSSDVSIDQVQ